MVVFVCCEGGGGGGVIYCTGMCFLKLNSFQYSIHELVGVRVRAVERVIPYYATGYRFQHSFDFIGKCSL